MKKASILLLIAIGFLSLSAGDICDGAGEKVEKASNLTGRVQVYKNGVWGTICSDNFGEKEAEMTCLQLGLKGGKLLSGQGDASKVGPVHMQKTNCSRGKVDRGLQQCDSDQWSDLFVKAPGKGEPYNGTEVYSLMVAKIDVPAPLQTAQDMCFQFPGCFGVGKKVPVTEGIGLSQLSRLGGNGPDMYGPNDRKRAADNQMRQAQWLVRNNVQCCQIKEDADLSLFKNSQTCTGGAPNGVTYRLDININENASTKWYFNVQGWFDGGCVATLDAPENGSRQDQIIHHTDDNIKWDSTPKVGNTQQDWMGPCDFEVTIPKGEHTVTIMGSNWSWQFDEDKMDIVDAPDNPMRIRFNRGAAAKPNTTMWFDRAWNSKEKKYIQQKDDWNVLTNDMLYDALSALVPEEEKKDQQFQFAKTGMNFSLPEALPFGGTWLYSDLNPSGKTQLVPDSQKTNSSPVRWKTVDNLQVWKLESFSQHNNMQNTKWGQWTDDQKVATASWKNSTDAKGDTWACQGTDGKWNKCKETQEQNCTVCQSPDNMLKPAKITYTQKMTVADAMSACASWGYQLPIQANITDKSPWNNCKGGDLIPLSLAKNNWNQYNSDKCAHSNDVVVKCSASDAYSRGKAFGNIRLLNSSDEIVRSEINFATKTIYDTNPNPGEDRIGGSPNPDAKNGEYKQNGRQQINLSIIRPDMFDVSEKLWELTPENPSKKGNMIFFKLDPQIVALGPEESFKVRWALVADDSTINYDLTSNSLAGQGNGGQWVFLDHAVLLTGTDETRNCAKTQISDTISEFQCWIEAIFVTPSNWCDPIGRNMPAKNGSQTAYQAEQSIQWKYIVKQDSELKVEMNGFKTVQDDGTFDTISGLSIKAADQCKCVFIQKPTSVGSDVKVKCQWDNRMLEFPMLNLWEQGQLKFGKPDPSKRVLSQPGGTGRLEKQQKGGDSKADKDETDPNWSYIILVADQQLNGYGIYHKLALTATLTKECVGCAKRRLGDRRLAGDEGKQGTQGFTLKAGYIKDGSNDDTDTTGGGSGGKKGEGESFGIVWSLLTMAVAYIM